MIRRVQNWFAPQPPTLEATLLDNRQGLVRRIAENRQILELLASEQPDFLLRHPWVPDWLTNQDRLLNYMALLAMNSKKPEDVPTFVHTIEAARCR